MREIFSSNVRSHDVPRAFIHSDCSGVRWRGFAIKHAWVWFRSIILSLSSEHPDALIVFALGSHAFIRLYLNKTKQLLLADESNGAHQNRSLTKEIGTETGITNIRTIRYDYESRADYCASAAVCVAKELIRLHNENSIDERIVPSK